MFAGKQDRDQEQLRQQLEGHYNNRQNRFDNRCMHDRRIEQPLAPLCIHTQVGANQWGCLCCNIKLSGPSPTHLKLPFNHRMVAVRCQEA